MKSECERASSPHALSSRGGEGENPTTRFSGFEARIAVWEILSPALSCPSGRPPGGEGENASGRRESVPRHQASRIANRK